MRWKTHPDAPNPRYRVVRKFAWLPVELSENTTVWLEYYREAQFSRFNFIINRWTWVLDDDAYPNRFVDFEIYTGTNSEKKSKPATDKCKHPSWTKEGASNRWRSQCTVCGEKQQSSGQ